MPVTRFLLVFLLMIILPLTWSSSWPAKCWCCSRTKSLFFGCWETNNYFKIRYRLRTAPWAALVEKGYWSNKPFPCSYNHLISPRQHSQPSPFTPPPFFFRGAGGSWTQTAVANENCLMYWACKLLAWNPALLNFFIFSTSQQKV